MTSTADTVFISVPATYSKSLELGFQVQLYSEFPSQDREENCHGRDRIRTEDDGIPPFLIWKSPTDLLLKEIACSPDSYIQGRVCMIITKNHCSSFFEGSYNMRHSFWFAAMQEI